MVGTRVVISSGQCYGLMVKPSEFESPAHITFSLVVNGVVTLISAVPGFAISDGSMTAVNSLALTTVVCLSPPFHRKTEAEKKLSPLTLKVNCGDPAVMAFGDSDEMLGGSTHSDLLLPQEARPRMAAASSTNESTTVARFLESRGILSLLYCPLVTRIGSPNCDIDDLCAALALVSQIGGLWAAPESKDNSQFGCNGYVKPGWVAVIVSVRTWAGCEVDRIARSCVDRE